MAELNFTATPLPGPLPGVSIFFDLDAVKRLGLNIYLDRFDVEQDTSALVQRLHTRLLTEYDRIWAEAASRPPTIPHAPTIVSEPISFRKVFGKVLTFEVFPFALDREHMDDHLRESLTDMLKELRPGSPAE